MVCEKVMDEADMDNDGRLSLEDFQHVIVRAPEFLRYRHTPECVAFFLSKGNTYSDCLKITSSAYRFIRESIEVPNFPKTKFEEADIGLQLFSMRPHPSAGLKVIICYEGNDQDCIYKHSVWNYCMLLDNELSSNVPAMTC